MDRLDVLPPYSVIFNCYLLNNKPFMLSSIATQKWKSLQDWVTLNGSPNAIFLKNKFGESEVPVADCDQCRYDAQPKTDWQLADYMDYLMHYKEDSYSSDSPCLYLKDWHFQREYPDYAAYTTPVYFTSDWLNEFWDSRTDEDDYRFVYVGVKGSWTPFHADVFRSFSWSANVCGRKKWIIYASGEEEALRDKLGNLPYDVTTVSDPDLSPLVVEQGPGEVIFIPSGWHHQVYNVEDTISINHNWVNGCNIGQSWEFIKHNLRDVEKEIADCRGMEGWQQQCQMILKASSGIDYKEFYVFLRTIAEKRLATLEQYLHSHRKISHKSRGINRESARENVLDSITTAVDDVFIRSPRDASSKRNDAPDEAFVEISTTENSGECDEAATKNRSQMECYEILSEPSDDDGCHDATPKRGVKQCSDFRPSCACHMVFDLTSILPVLNDMVTLDEFTCIDFTDCGVTPAGLIEQIGIVISNLKRH